MFSKLAHENRRNRSEKPEPLPLDKQVELAMSRLVMLGASPEKDLWRAVDQVSGIFHKRIERLELMNKILKAEKL